ncbi:MAG: hypothetical protein ACM3PA_00380 [Methanomassiliicoccales archaeon]
MRKVYDNVDSSRFSCMRRDAQRQTRQFASQYGYTIQKLQMPEGDNTTWRAVLAKGASSLEIAIKVSRNNNKLILEVVKMPSSIISAVAIRKVDAIYRHCG